MSGHAVEARLCAERPREDYRPTPGTATPRGLAAGSGVADRRRHRVGEHGQPLVRLAGGQGHGPRRHQADGHRAPGPGAASHSRSMASRPTATLLEAILDDPVFRHGDAGIDYLDGRDDLRDAVPADDVRHRHAAAAALRPPAPPRRREPRPRPGRRMAQRRHRPPRRHPRPTRSGRSPSAPGDQPTPSPCWWTASGRTWASRHDDRRVRRPHLRRRAAALPGPAGRAARRGQRARGPVELHPAHRGRSGRAGRDGGGVPGAAARRHHAGHGDGRRHRRRRRRVGGARGHEDGAHAALRRRRHGDPGPVRAGRPGGRGRRARGGGARSERRAQGPAGGQLQRLLR